MHITVNNFQKKLHEKLVIFFALSTALSFFYACLFAHKMSCNIRLILALVALMSLIQSVVADIPNGIVVQGRLVIPDGSKPGNLRVVLNGGQHETLSRMDGSFSFYLPTQDVTDNNIIGDSDALSGFPNGIYSLDVLSTHTVFSSMKVKVLIENDRMDKAIHAVEYKFPGATKIPAAYPIVMEAIITPSGTTGIGASPGSQKRVSNPLDASYFAVKKQFNMMGYIMANPMMLMMGVMLILVVVMPKMLEGMDPEELKKMQEQRGGEDIETDPMKAFQKLMGVKEAPEEDD